MDNYFNLFREMISLRGLSDRSVNAVIAQLRFFTIYVLNKPWMDSQLPTRRFDSYLPFVPSQEDTWVFISSIHDLRFKAIVSLMYSAGLRSGEVRHLKYSDISRKDMRIHILHSKNPGMTAMLPFLQTRSLS